MGRTLRPRARLTVAVLAALGWGFFFFGLIDLLASFLPFADFEDYYLLEGGWGVLYFILVSVPLLSLAFVPTLTSPMTQVGLAGLAVAAAAVLTQTWLQLLPSAGLLIVAAVLFLLGGPDSAAPAAADQHSAHRSRRLDLPSLILAAAAAVPLVWLSLQIGVSVRAGIRLNDDISAGLSHWPMQAALWLALPAIATLAAVRQTGWQVSAWTVTIGTGWMGLLSVAHPHHAGSLGLAGGAAAILWAALFTASTLRFTHTRTGG